ncbi:hypothetical protein HHL11_09115 [Ramlibacter sp. G-1-2-2]|uniref:DUF3592 domain-containing protein n=1 Tax=Ramlibacter agri TaxID=2728837 RepID=A0A848H0C9_9BURK|nr:hypothetical protein [Ramlibacter agri]NML43907.1 hypothetical protein [Ramlibacter agri]
MKLQTIALALTVAAGGIASQAFAQDVSVTHERADGAVVTKHIRSDEPGVVHKTVRVTRPDGSTYVRRTTRTTTGYLEPMPHRTVVIHHRYDPERHVVVREVRHDRPDVEVNRHVTVIHDAS